MTRRGLRIGALAMCLGAGCLSPADSAAQGLPGYGHIDVHAALCTGDPETPLIRARNLRHDAVPANLGEYARTGDGDLRLPAGYYQISTQTQRCYAQAFVAVVAGQRRHVTPTLGPEDRLDGSMGFAGSVAALAPVLRLADYDRPTLTYELETERNYFYANLAPKRYVLTVTQTDGTTSRFGIDLSGGIAGDLATIDIGLADLQAHANATGPYFSSVDDIDVSGGRTWFVDSGRGVVGSFGRSGVPNAVRVDGLHGRGEIRADGIGGVWAFGERADDVVHVDALGATRLVHMPPHDAQETGSVGAAVATDGGLVIVRDRLQTLYHVALDGTISSAQLRPGYNAKNFGIDSAGVIYFTQTDAGAPLARYTGGVLDSVAVADVKRPEAGLDVYDDAFEQGRFDGTPDATFRFGLRGTHESAAVSGAVHDGTGGLWATDCNVRNVVHVRADRSRLSFPIPAGFCPTSLSAGASGLWLIDHKRRGIVNISPSGTQQTFQLPAGAAAREESMRVAPDGTLWVIERNPSHVAYIRDGRVVELQPFGVGGPQASILR